MDGRWQDDFAGEYRAINETNPELARKFSGLCENIQGYDTALVAFSGGADSALLAFLGSRLLDRCLCVIADSPTIPRDELAGAGAFAETHGLELKIIRHNELDDPQFRRNDRDRCFHCKNGLFNVMSDIMEKEGLDAVFDGSNFDDLDDYRPGRRAAELNHVRSPLLESGLGKADIRDISQILGLGTWDKPQMACLSSRVPYDTGITEEILARIERAEKIVRNLGYIDVRVRFHGDTARIELGQDEDIDLMALRNAAGNIRGLGFKYVVLDLEGYRTGSLNE